MLIENQTAPDLTLPAYPEGESNLYQQTETAVLVFYKFSCGTCRFTFPFLETIYQNYGSAFYFRAIAQDPPEKVEEFRRELGITIPTLMDLKPYDAGRSYQIKSVPSIFLVGSDHRIRFASEGFARHEIQHLADILAEKSGRPQIDLFEHAEVPDFKPG